MIGSHQNDLGPNEKPDYIGGIPFFAVHMLALVGLARLVIRWWLGLPIGLEVVVIAGLYCFLMFVVVAGLHRYFSHRSYEVRGWFAKVLAVIVTLPAQKGAIWWSSHHRLHHRHSDTEKDVHSAWLRGIYWAHCGWVLCRKYQTTAWEAVADLRKSDWLRFLNRPYGYLIAPVLLGATCFGVGAWLAGVYSTSGWGLLLNFFVAVTINYHITFCINSLAHLWGTHPHNTGDKSRNNVLLAIITLGEGWHNEHHHAQGYEPQGHRWYQIDIAHWVIMLWALVGLVTKINLPPRSFSARFLRTLRSLGFVWVPSPLSK